MITSVSPLCLACGLLLVSADAARAQDRSTKVYDVRCLLAAETQWLPGWIGMPGEGQDEVPRTGRRADEPAQAMTAANLMQMLHEGLGPATNGAGEPMLKIVGDVLFATASEDEHRRLATWVDFCQQLFLEQVTIEVHLLPAKALAGAKGRLLRAEVDNVLRATGAHPAFACSARVGSSSLLRSDDSIRYVRDYDVEVAQKSTMNDPKVDTLVNGHVWSIATSRCADGRLLVHVASQASQRQEHLRTIDIPHRDLSGKPQLLAVQLPVVHFAEEFASGRLADGDALVFGGGANDEVLCCLRIRRANTIPAPSGADWSWCFTADLTTPKRRCAVAHLRLDIPGDEAPLFDEPGDSEATMSTDELLDLLRQLPGFADAEQFALLPSDALRVRGPEGARKAANELLVSLANTLVREISVEVRCGKLPTVDAALATDGRLDVGELAGRLPTTCLTGTLLDHDFHRTAITQHAHISDYEVEIAQESGVPNPVIGSINTGTSIRGRVTAVAHDRYRLRLEASFAELAGELALFDLKDDHLGPVELARLRTATFAVSPVVDAKRWTLVYLAPLHGTSDHFVCVARVLE